MQHGAFFQGGIERGKGHYPSAGGVAHGIFNCCRCRSLDAGSPIFNHHGKHVVCDRTSLSGLRWWCINTLGQRWNTRVILVPNLPRITDGPYKYLSHPNYVIVALEGLALPLTHNAYLTAAAFTILNAGLMGTNSL